MFIEFFCPSCNQRLRVPESNAGKQARCPSCEQVNEIPMSSPAPEMPVGDHTADDENPFASPGRAAAMPDGGSLEFGTPDSAGLMPWPSQKIDAPYAFSNAWALFQKNMGLMIGAIVLMTVANYVMSGIQSVLQLGIGSAVDPDSATGQVILGVVILGCIVIQQAIQIFLSIGLVRIMFAIARDQPAEINMLWSGGPWFLRGAGAGILYILMVMLGLVALIIPGIYLALRYWSYLHFIVDKDCTIGEAFSQAGELGSTNMGDSFIMGLLAMGVNILGFLACCIGVLFSAPVTSLAWTLAYLMMTGQPFRQDALRG